jgi:hypothetical protein
VVITLRNSNVVKCKIYTRSFGANFILKSKIDGLRKHAAF